jgi:hypothetical protein
MGGCRNCISDGSCESSIIGGCRNTIDNCSCQSSILGGYYNYVVFGSCYSSIIGGCRNTISGISNSAIIGGANLCLTSNNTVYVPTLMTTTISNINPVSWKLGTTASGSVTVDTTQYIEVSIDGVTYKLAVVQ